MRLGSVPPPLQPLVAQPRRDFGVCGPPSTEPIFLQIELAAVEHTEAAERGGGGRKHKQGECVSQHFQGFHDRIPRATATPTTWTNGAKPQDAPGINVDGGSDSEIRETPRRASDERRRRSGGRQGDVPVCGPRASPNRASTRTRACSRPRETACSGSATLALAGYALRYDTPRPRPPMSRHLLLCVAPRIFHEFTFWPMEQ